MLSKESEQFIGNLRAYLHVTGKREKEINEIISELEDHLIEAEKDGKSVEDIIGQSPKAYMQSIGSEMKTNRKGMIGAALAVVVGALSISLMPEVVTGELSYSLFKIISTLIVLILFLISLAFSAKKLSESNATDRKASFMIAGILIAPFFLFLGLYYIDTKVSTPSLELTGIPVYLIGLFLSLFLIAVSIWTKSWLLILVVFILVAPEVMQVAFELTDESTLELSSIFFGLSFIVLIAYLFFNNKKDKAS